MTAITATARNGIRGAHTDRVWLWFGLPGLSFLIVFFLVPIGWLMSTSVLEPSFGLQNFLTIFTTPGYIEIIGQTLWLSFVATAVTFVLGYPLAYLIVNSESQALRRWLLIAIVSSQLISILTRTFAWQVILGRQGPINQWSSFIFGHGTGSLLFTQLATIVGLVHFLLPFMVLPLITVMQRINRDTVASAAILGAGPAMKFFRVFVPMTIAGIGIGTVLVFIYGVGSFATPALLGGRDGIMASVIIESALSRLGDYGLAASFSIILLVCVIAIVAFYRVFLAGRMEWLLNAEAASQPSVPSRSRPRSAISWLMAAPTRAVQAFARFLDRTGVSRSSWPPIIFIVVSLIFILGPQIVTIAVSFSGTRSLVFPPSSWSLRWFENFFTQAWLMPTWISIEIAVIASFFAVLLGGTAACCVARCESRLMRVLLPTAMLLPLLIPSVVTAAAFYIFLLQLNLNDTVTGIVVAHTCLLLPFAFSTVLANLQSIDKSPEQAAANLGASPFRVVIRILLPQIYSGLTVAFFLCFLVSFDEAVIGIFLSGINVETLPAHMYAAISKSSDPTVGVPGTLMLAIAVSVFLAERLWHRVPRQASESYVKNY